jgi:hypothetical protein
MPAQDKPGLTPENGVEENHALRSGDRSSPWPKPPREIPRGVANDFADDLVHDPIREAGEGQGELFGPDNYDWDDERREPQARLFSADSVDERKEVLRPAQDESEKRTADSSSGQTAALARDEIAFASPQNEENDASERNPPDIAKKEIHGSDRNNETNGNERQRVRRRVRIARSAGKDESARRWKSHARQRKDALPGYAYIIFVLIFFGAIFLARVVWQGESSLFEAPPLSSQSSGTADTPEQAVQDVPMPSGAKVIPWERDALQALDSSQKHAAQGAVASAEADLDRADSSLTAARLQSQPVDPGFFQAAISALDRVLQQRPQDTKLFGIVTSSRVEVAALRSAQQIPSGALGTRAVSFATSRPLSPGDTVDPGTLGGVYLDATVMADAVEIFVPPTARSLADNVNVDGMTIAGATQTIDGIHWHKVEFVDTRLRYADGDVDLQDVRFVRCTFTLPDDERGAQLADAIALGKASFTIGAPPPQQNPRQKPQ